MTEKYFSRLNELMLAKKNILTEIFSLTKAQTDTITEDSLDDLKKLIDEKQIKIDKMLELDDDFETYFGRLKSVLGISKLSELDAAKLDPASAEGAAALKETIGEIMELAGRITELEKINDQKSNKLLDRFGEEIRKINQSKRANLAYKPIQPIAPSYFIDKKK
jgi:hypothetical protein